ncbi:NUDIX domain-containing protein [Nesterenkonia sp. LB17]|uniref:NUDIX hydrolase n=1 Tax=unclassified Nesterenkonia TaxID=2629769 RepID=UPI001F4CBA06|nr:MULTISPECIES: NUDIX domain-containing protein [unclassified Nesterenkonia]MCH8560199.1 NUDIX domain-containing protein [Nesterenkonia sp. DZ6]MCH8563797.1 NUDIX domain-containing protein [Nesterenkonia sp. YGD6]MCH8565580.1 NUDIX domain-containing protein [Nesterenkonia sp. LB17]MCH8571666.1 NUDIX domain-containing protein [Nesterenkonia sp. AY15]
MPTPDFIKELRQDIGTKELWIPAARGVVLRRGAVGGEAAAPSPAAPSTAETEVLLVRRADNGAWTVTSGILDPGEDPAVGAVREVEEETGVVARPVRVAGVFATGLVRYPNGDACRYLDTVLEMEPISGQARVNDDESVEVGWFPVSALPEPISEDQRMVIDWALDTEAPARFRS